MPKAKKQPPVLKEEDSGPSDAEDLLDEEEDAGEGMLDYVESDEDETQGQQKPSNSRGTKRKIVQQDGIDDENGEDRQTQQIASKLQQPKKQILNPLYAPPTNEEVMNLTQTEQLFQSNLWKLQVFVSFLVLAICSLE